MVDVELATSHNKDVPLETIIGQDQVVDELDTALVATKNVGRDPAAKHGGKTSQYGSSRCPSTPGGGWVQSARSGHPSACGCGTPGSAVSRGYLGQGRVRVMDTLRRHLPDPGDPAADEGTAKDVLPSPVVTGREAAASLEEIICSMTTSCSAEKL